MWFTTLSCLLFKNFGTIFGLIWEVSSICARICSGSSFVLAVFIVIAVGVSLFHFIIEYTVTFWVLCFAFWNTENSPKSRKQCIGCVPSYSILRWEFFVHSNITLTFFCEKSKQTFKKKVANLRKRTISKP